MPYFRGNYCLQLHEPKQFQRFEVDIGDGVIGQQTDIGVKWQNPFVLSSWENLILQIEIPEEISKGKIS